MGQSYSKQNSIRKTEKEKEENIWRRKKSFVGEKKIGEGKGENIWRRKTISFLGEE